jgi:putative acetyltransferase
VSGDGGVGAGEVSFRPGVGDDAPAVASVFGAARGAMTYLPALHTPEEDLAFFSGHVLPLCRVMVAEVEVEGGGVVGFSAVGDGWLEHLYVAPGWQGGGIGGALLGLAMKDNPSGLSLWVFAANHRAFSFYERAGFAEVLRTDGNRNEERQPDVQMRWAGRGA